MRRKVTFNENCSINYQRNKCKGKQMLRYVKVLENLIPRQRKIAIQCFYESSTFTPLRIQTMKR